MKQAMTYREQIEKAKEVVSTWSAERRSWMQAQGTNEYVERRSLDNQSSDPQPKLNQTDR